MHRTKIFAAFCLFAGSLTAFQAPQTPPAAQAQPPAVPTASIEGQVFNLATGAPLKRASVRLFAIGAGGGRGGGPVELLRETDDTGRFVFPNLDPGRYRLSAERQGYLRANYGGRKYNTSGTPIVLGKDQHLTELVLKMSPQSVIVGKVLDEDGDPVASVQVRAFKMGYRDGKKQWVQAGSGTTSDIGEYRIPQLEPGRYLVSTVQLRVRVGSIAAAAPLPNTPDLRYAATYYPSSLQEASAAPVDVAPGGETRGIDVRLRKTEVFRVRGRVVVPAEGHNVPMVFVASKDGTRGGPATVPARPPDYRFEVTGLSPGAYFVYAQNNGQDRSLAFQSIDIQNRHIDGVVLSPTPGADLNGTVKVDDANGGTVDVSKLTVVVRPSIEMGRPARGRVGATGAFVLNGVVPLRYTVNVQGIPEGCYVKSIRYGGRVVGEDGFDVVGGGTLDVTLGADAGSVSATVLDRDGNPLSSAMVALIAREGGPIEGRTTNETGGVAFNGLKPGDYTLIAWEDIPPGAHQDPDFVKQYSGTDVKVEPRGKPAVQVKAVPAE